MEDEDPKAYDTLRKHFAEIARSNLDPADLARELFAAKIIGRAKLDEVSNPSYLAQWCLKRQSILTEVMSSGKPRAFQNFVRIILKMDQCDWLGKKLIGT